MSNPYEPNPYEQQPAPGQAADPYGQYPPSGPTPNPYGGQPYYPVAPEHPQGSTVQVLGYLGIIIPICAAIAWYIGSKTLTEIAGSGRQFSNEQQIRTGRLLGKVFTIIYAALIGLYILGVIAFVIFAASSS